MIPMTHLLGGFPEFGGVSRRQEGVWSLRTPSLHDYHRLHLAGRNHPLYAWITMNDSDLSSPNQPSNVSIERNDQRDLNDESAIGSNLKPACQARSWPGLLILKSTKSSAKLYSLESK